MTRAAFRSTPIMDQNELDIDYSQFVPENPAIKAPTHDSNTGLPLEQPPEPEPPKPAAIPGHQYGRLIVPKQPGGKGAAEAEVPPDKKQYNAAPSQRLISRYDHYLDKKEYQKELERKRIEHAKQAEAAKEKFEREALAQMEAQKAEQA